MWFKPRFSAILKPQETANIPRRPGTWEGWVRDLELRSEIAYGAYVGQVPSNDNDHLSNFNTLEVTCCVVTSAFII